MRAPGQGTDMGESSCWAACPGAPPAPWGPKTAGGGDPPARLPLAPSRGASGAAPRPVPVIWTGLLEKVWGGGSCNQVSLCSVPCEGSVRKQMLLLTRRPSPVSCPGLVLATHSCL